MKSSLLLLCLLPLLLFPPAASARLDPRLEWRTLESAHFSIHYHQGGKEIAEQGARIAEEVHRRLIGELGWEPGGRTDLVLADVSDAPNGMATPFPTNRIIIYLTPPLGEPFSLTDREDWLRLVITHEYTHILHLDTVRRLPAVLRKVFGRVYFPNAYQPEWVIEGLATYEETRATEGGRGRSSFTDMVLRMAVLENRFPRLSQAGVPLDSWPDGEVPYLFGTGFFEHLVERFGDDLPKRVSNGYAGRPLPFMVDSTARAAFGSTYKKEWPQWQRELAARYEEVRRQVEERGPTPLTMLTDEGFENLSPAVSPDGRRLAFASRTADRPAELWVMRIDGTEKRRIGRRFAPPGGGGIAWTADGSALVYAGIERDAFDNLYSDLFRYDLQRDRKERLTRGLRAAGPDLSPKTGDIVFTVKALGRSRLAVSDGRGENLRFLSEEDDTADYDAPKWSPDGERIAVGVKETGGRFSIRILSSSGEVLDRISAGGAIVANPAWTPDGRTVLFSSDEGGIFNIQAYRIEERALFRVTEVLGGAFTPALSPDGGTLFLSAYDASGFDLASTPLRENAWKRLPAPPSPPSDGERVESAAAPAGQLADRPYSPWRSLLPRYWFPWFGGDEDGLQLGATSSGRDALGRHDWAATLLYGIESERPAYSLLYTYEGLLPTVQAFASDQAVLFSDFDFETAGGTERDFWERRKTFGVDLIIPFAGLWSRHRLIPGYRYQEFRSLVIPPPGGLAPDEGALSGIRLSYLFDNTVRPPKSISAEEGRRLALAVQHDGTALGSDFTLTRCTLDWREFTGMPWSRHHVLATRVFGGWAGGDVFAQRAFQVGGDPPGDILLGVDSEHLPLRGYPLNEFRGQRLVLGSLEYRFPVVNLEVGAGNGPFFLRRIHGAVFAEGADAFDSGGLRLDDFRTSSGLEARFDADLGYFLPVTLRLVLAQGHDEEGETQAYLSLWLRF